VAETAARFSAPPDSVRRLAIIGVGTAGLHHARAAMALGHRITKASARSESSARWQAFQATVPGVQFEAVADNLLVDPEIDAIVAALPWDVMPQWLARLVSCRKSVLLEKPVALSAGAIEAVLAHPNAAPGNKLVGFNRRFYGTVARLRTRIAEGGLKAAQIAISEPLDRHIRVHGPAVVPHVLSFSSAHTLDLAWHLLGPMAVVRVYAHREVESAFTCLNGLVETAGGTPVSLAINANDPAPAGIRFLFDDHTSWLLAPLETLTVYDRYDVNEARPHSAIRRYVPHACWTYEESAELKPGFVEQMSVFLSGEYGPGARLTDALAIQRFVETLMGTAR